MIITDHRLLEVKGTSQCSRLQFLLTTPLVTSETDVTQNIFPLTKSFQTQNTKSYICWDSNYYNNALNQATGAAPLKPPARNANVEFVSVFPTELIFQTSCSYRQTWGQSPFVCKARWGAGSCCWQTPRRSLSLSAGNKTLRFQQIQHNG